MSKIWCALASTLLLCGSCELVIKATDPRRPRPVPTPPAPGGETEPHQPPAGPYAHLPQRASFTTKADTQLRVGCYHGDFVCGRAQLEVAGSGIDKTVIDGNLLVATQCEISNLTVTGDVVFQGNQARLVDVDFYGQIIDKGLQNRY